jgi:hypothetical protein
MSQIFVSYSRRDLEIVDCIVEKIESAGMSVWIDREDIKAGKTWRVQIVEAIATCDAFVLMLSPNSAASDNVRKEIDLAQDSGRAVFIMRLEPVKLPAEMLYQLVGLQHIELQALGVDKGVSQLIDTLEGHLATWQPPEDRTVRQAELVFQEGAHAEFGAKKQEQTLGLISALTETPQSQLDIANLSAGGVHVFVEMPAAAAFELKTRALNRDSRLKQFGVKSLRLAGDKQYVNLSLGILTTTATIGTLNMLWMSVPSVLPSLFGVAAGKVIVITSVVAITATSIAVTDKVAHGLNLTQTTTSATNTVPPPHNSPTSVSGEGTLFSASTPAEIYTPASVSGPTIPPIGMPQPAVTITPTRSPTKPSSIMPSTPVPSHVPTSTMTSTEPSPLPIFQVTGASLQADPINYVGPCPVRITFSGRISVNGSGTVSYKFLRNDGASASIQTLTFDGPGSQDISTTWDLGASGTTYSGWEQIQILDPQSLTSNQATFNIQCQDQPPPGLQVVEAILRADPFDYVGPCPVRITFSGRISVIGSGTVAYRFLRNDGASAPIQTLTFDGSGSQDISTTWDIGGAGFNYSGWEQIQILDPQTMTSNQATFNIQCESPAVLQVTDTSLQADPVNYVGPCPVRITFSGTISVNGSGTVSYKFLRSDGAVAPTQTLTFNGPGSQNVSTTWDLGGAGMTYSGWEQIQILDPQSLTSNQATFSIQCESPTPLQVTDVSLQADPIDYAGACPVRITFSGRISVNGSGSVSYKFLRSDSAIAPTQTLTFDGPGSQDISTTWDLGGAGETYSGWEQIQILDPGTLTSNQATFNIQCQ